MSNVKIGLRLQREITKKILPRNNKSNVKTGLRLKEIMPKESLPRNHKNNVKTGLRRPGHRDTGNINDDRDTGTQLQRAHQMGGTGGISK